MVCLRTWIALERVMHFRLQVIDWGYGTPILPQRYLMMTKGPLSPLT